MQANTEDPNHSAPSDQEVCTVCFSWLVSDSLRQRYGSSAATSYGVNLHIVFTVYNIFTSLCNVLGIFLHVHMTSVYLQ